MSQEYAILNQYIRKTRGASEHQEVRRLQISLADGGGRAADTEIKTW